MGQFVGRCLRGPATPREQEQEPHIGSNVDHLYASSRSDGSSTSLHSSASRSATPERESGALDRRRLSAESAGLRNSSGRRSGGPQHNLSFVDQHVDSFSSFGSTDDERSSYGPEAHLSFGMGSLPRNPSWGQRLDCDMKSCKKSVTEDGRKMINEYTLIKKLGQGSYGKVYLAEDHDRRKYAIKMIKKAIFKSRKLTSSDKMDMMFREIAIMKRLDHTNIVHLYDVIDDKAGQAIYLVMEYVEGGPVMNCEQERAPLPEETARNYFRDIITGLDFVHSNHIVHMDIKPENLLVGADGRVRITDFGVSSIFQGSNDMINRCKGGSPAFTAPEIILGESSYSGKLADIWAVGVSLYYFIFGRCPFAAESIPQLFYRIANAELLFPRRLSPDLEDLIRRLLTKSPAERITMAELLRHPWVTENGARPIHSNSRRRPLTFPMMVKIKTTMRKRALQARQMIQAGTIPETPSGAGPDTPASGGPGLTSSIRSLASSGSSYMSLASSSGSIAAVPLLSVTAPSPTIPEDWAVGLAGERRRRRSSPSGEAREKRASRSRSPNPAPSGASPASPSTPEAGPARPRAQPSPVPPPPAPPAAPSSSPAAAANPAPLPAPGGLPAKQALRADSPVERPLPAVVEEPVSPSSRSLPGDNDWDEEPGSAGQRERAAAGEYPAALDGALVPPALTAVTLDDIKVVLERRGSRSRSPGDLRAAQAATQAAAREAAGAAGGGGPCLGGEQPGAASASSSRRRLSERMARSRDRSADDSGGESDGAGPSSVRSAPAALGRRRRSSAPSLTEGLEAESVDGSPAGGADGGPSPPPAPPTPSSLRSGPASPPTATRPPPSPAGRHPAPLRSASTPHIGPPHAAPRRYGRGASVTPPPGPASPPWTQQGRPWNQHAERLAAEFAEIVARRRRGRRDSSDSDSTTLSEFIGTPAGRLLRAGSASSEAVPAAPAGEGPDSRSASPPREEPGTPRGGPPETPPRPPPGASAASPAVEAGARLPVIPEHGAPAGSGPSSPTTPQPPVLSDPTARPPRTTL